MSNKKNLANGIIDGSVSAVATSVNLKTGYGAGMGTPPFMMTFTPLGQLSTDGNSEIVRVTGVSTDTLTVVRAQRGTTAKTFSDGDIASLGVLVEDVNGIDVTVTTAATTAAKVGTTSNANYVPCEGDEININFTLGCNVATPTLNIDGSGAKNIRLGTVNVSTTLIGVATAFKLKAWYDGTYWQIYGSHKNDNTTYTEIYEAEITTSSATTRAMTGRRAQFIISQARAGVVKSDSTDKLTVGSTAPVSPTTGDLWGDTSSTSIDSLVIAVGAIIMPVGTIYSNKTDGTNPATKFGFGTWVAIQGEVIAGYKSGDPNFGTIGASVGSATHTLTVGEMPAHNHSIERSPNSVNGNNATNVSTYPSATTSMSTGNAGGGAAHNNIQPTRVAYVWERTV